MIVHLKWNAHYILRLKNESTLITFSSRNDKTLFFYDNDNINVHFKIQTKIYNIKKIMKQLFLVKNKPKS